jgi:prepilin-type processing-associated H-X9-DG protein
LLRAAFVSFIIAIVSVTSFGQSAPTITKVDPPSWWVNHTVNPIRLLIRGKNLTGARVRSGNASLTVSNLRQSSNYLFVDLHVRPGTKPGNYALLVETETGKVEVPFTIETARDTDKNFQGINNDDVIYLIMIDRFADGDRSNNAADDVQNARSYHGGDLRGIIDRLPYLKELGVTALWLTPWHDNWNGVNRCDKPWCPNTYYHGYHAIDYYAVEDRFGDLRTLRELVDKAHALGLKVIQDQVANHVGSQHPWVNDPPLPNWFHGTLAHHQLNTFRNSVLLSPHSHPRDVRNVLDGWFSDDLPDMNQEEPEVARYEIQNALWWVGVTGIDGIRQDTIQYMPRTFIRDLSLSLHRQYPKLWMVGEVFEREAAHTAFFIGGHTGWDGIDTRLDSVFDFALWNTSLSVFTNKLPVRALRDQLKYDALYPDPAKLTVLANNHDTPRFLSLKDADLKGAKLHTAFILSVRGIPQLYYGEEIGMQGGEDPDNRRDFPARAFDADGRNAQEREMFEWTRDWIRLRREHSALRRGRLIDLVYDENVYVFGRQDNSETLIIGINRQDKEQEVSLPFKALTPLLGKIRVTGGANVVLPANSAVAFKAS